LLRSLYGNIYLENAVTLTISGYPFKMDSGAGIIKLYPEDRVILAGADDALKEGIIGQKVTVDHATPIKLNLFGKNYRRYIPSTKAGVSPADRGKNL